ncbi:PAS domain-containing protein [Methanoculleus chikugoensis]|uniref:PAS domain-containing protein n=1 Tax=Methanoculleus chikugoensis TaxID=118126 RepID=UPI001FB2D7DC|nr:PAS domain-containing protein [Methanoculleus chikugoensis]
MESQTELICRRLPPDGTITFANDAYCGYVGIPCGDLIGRRYALTIPADDQARIQESLASLTPRPPGIDGRAPSDHAGRQRPVAAVDGYGVLRRERFRRRVPVGRPGHHRCADGGGRRSFLRTGNSTCSPM